MDGLDSLGAEELHQPRKSWLRRLFSPKHMVSVAVGAVAAALVPKHPVLAFLGSAALASNTQEVLSGEKTLKTAVRRMGCHVVATAGSLALPSYPGFGYVAGAVAGELLLDGNGNGIVEELVDTPKSDPNIIDAEFVETKPKTQALVKQ